MRKEGAAIVYASLILPRDEEGDLDLQAERFLKPLLPDDPIKPLVERMERVLKETNCFHPSVTALFLSMIFTSKMPISKSR
jgi:hypothetical protein